MTCFSSKNGMETCSREHTESQHALSDQRFQQEERAGFKRGAEACSRERTESEPALASIRYQIINILSRACSESKMLLRAYDTRQTTCSREHTIQVHLQETVDATAWPGRRIRLRTVSGQTRKSNCSREHAKARMRTATSNAMCLPESNMAQGRECRVQGLNGNMLSQEDRK